MKNFNILALALLAIASSACSFLDEEPKGLVTSDSFYRNDKEARQALNGMYRNLAASSVTGYEIKNIPNDLLKRATWDEGSGLSDFTYGSENSSIATMWQGHYSVIKDCNSVIANVEANRSDISTADVIIAQARGVRAFLYFDLARWFGDVPLIVDETSSLDGLEVVRTPVKDVFEQIITDFKFCADHSFSKGETDKGYQYGRMTSEACHGFLA